MKKILGFFVLSCVVLLLATSAGATVMVSQQAAGSYDKPDGFTTYDMAYLVNFEHDYYYKWCSDDFSQDNVNQVDIVFHGIYDHLFGDDILNLYIKDTSGKNESGWYILPLGTDWGSDANPNWLGDGYTSIGNWTYPDGSGQYDVVFSITDQGIIGMMFGDDQFVLGIDPDCYYTAQKVSINAGTAPVPEPATMLLLGSGLLGLAGLGRKRARRQ